MVKSVVFFFLSLEGSESISKGGISMFQEGSSGSNYNTSCYNCTEFVSGTPFRAEGNVSVSLAFAGVAYTEGGTCPISQKMSSRAPG